MISEPAPPHLPRTMSKDRVLQQVGYLGASGTFYPNGAKVSEHEPGGWSEMYISVGVWQDLGDGHYGIKD